MWIHVWIGPDVDPMLVHITAWMDHEKERKMCRQFHSLEEQQLQLGCWIASLHDKFSAWKFDSLATWLYNSLSWPLGMANRCKPPHPKNMQPSLDHTSTHQYMILFRRCRSTGFEQTGSCLGPGLQTDLRF